MKKKNVMVVDDSHVVVAVVKQALEAEGYGVQCAYSGEELLSCLEGEKPDLIILDVVMPQMSGFEALSRLKNSAETSSIPVIMLTGNGHPSDVLGGYKLGAEYYITKPFKSTELLYGVHLVLGN